MMMKPLGRTRAVSGELMVVMSALCTVRSPARGQEMQPSHALAPRGDTSCGPVNMDENLSKLWRKFPGPDLRLLRDRV